MISRIIADQVEERLQEMPVVALLGSRQVGKRRWRDAVVCGPCHKLRRAGSSSTGDQGRPDGAEADAYDAGPSASSELGKALGWDQKTVKSYCDLLKSLFLLRQLLPWSGNLKKRLVKAPKVFLRDAGLLHSMLGLDGMETLLGHPVCGHSWEGFCIEQILGASSLQWRATHYRTHTGSEVDLILEHGQRRIAIEIRRT